jgi:transposase
MRIVYARCCGLDVHKKSISACLLVPDEKGGTRQEVRRFGAMTRDLLLLSDWLAANQVTHVAMESTGVYWKPVWNILEEHYTILLVNAQHVKAVLGGKQTPRIASGSPTCCNMGCCMEASSRRARSVNSAI